jgi:peptidoglycan/LPS O-acetylase OafA/YrhL
MDPLSPIFAIVIFLIAFATAYVLTRTYKIENASSRYETIDGIRGFLALGVFIYHSAVWFQFLHINSWEVPKSNLYIHLGQTSVSLFFMITAFLFVTKILNARNGQIDWKALYVSRIFRLVPMYLVSIFVLVLIVFIIGNWKANEPWSVLAKELFYWATFGIIKHPEINDFDYTNIINAGIVWSLAYEWLFYLSLPIISILISAKRTSVFYTLLSVIFIIGYTTFRSVNIHHILSFAGGVSAAFLIRYKPKTIDFESRIFSLIVILSLFGLLFFDTADDLMSKVLIILIFNLVALGNSIFGILKSRSLKFLGEICYSTYLIHGIVLFIVMYFFIDLEDARHLPVVQFWATIFLLTPVVVILSYILFRYIEKPYMNYSKRLLSKNKISNGYADLPRRQSVGFKSTSNELMHNDSSRL